MFAIRENTILYAFLVIFNDICLAIEYLLFYCLLYCWYIGCAIRKITVQDIHGCMYTIALFLVQLLVLNPKMMYCIIAKISNESHIHSQSF